VKILHKIILENTQMQLYYGMVKPVPIMVVKEKQLYYGMVKPMPIMVVKEKQLYYGMVKPVPIMVVKEKQLNMMGKHETVDRSMTLNPKHHHNGPNWFPFQCIFAFP